jgi:hypothetical protein
MQDSLISAIAGTSAESIHERALPKHQKLEPSRKLETAKLRDVANRLFQIIDFRHPSCSTGHPMGRRGLRLCRNAGLNPAPGNCVVAIYRAPGPLLVNKIVLSVDRFCPGSRETLNFSIAKEILVKDPDLELFGHVKE